MSNTSKRCNPLPVLLGREALVQTLARQLEDGRSHVFLFEGAPGLGKRTCARSFAYALLASKTSAGLGPLPETAEALGTLLAEHPDFTELLPQGKDKTIRVADLREKVLADMVKSPHMGGLRIFLLPLDLIQEAGQNLLLKSLEEPPAYVRFLLTASEPAKVLPTLRSRATCLPLPPLASEACQALWAAEPAWASLLEAERAFVQAYAAGNPGRGLALLADASFLPYAQAVAQFWTESLRLGGRETVGAQLRRAQALIGQSERAQDFLSLTARFWAWVQAEGLRPGLGDQLHPLLATPETGRPVLEHALSPQAQLAIQTACGQCSEALVAHVQAEATLTQLILWIREVILRG